MEMTMAMEMTMVRDRSIPAPESLLKFCGRGLENHYKLLLIILIRFNVRIEPLGYGRLIIHVFVSLVVLLRSTFILEM
jgi:hypothetical protein